MSQNVNSTFWKKRGTIIGMKQIFKAGGILLKDNKLLVTWSQGKDIFFAPGGKIEEGETPEQALIRELYEELHIEIDIESLEKFGIWSANAAGELETEITMYTYIVTNWIGEINPENEIEEIQWIDSSTLQNVTLGSIFKHEVIPKLKERGLIA